MAQMTQMTQVTHLLGNPSTPEQLAAENALAPSPMDDPQFLLRLFVVNSRHPRAAARVGKRDWLNFARTLRPLIPGDHRDRLFSPLLRDTVDRLRREIKTDEQTHIRCLRRDVRMVLAEVGEAIRLRDWMDYIARCHMHDGQAPLAARRALQGLPAPAEPS